MILLLMDYNDQFYNFSLSPGKIKLQKLQNKALRIIYKMHTRSNTDGAHAAAKLFFLDDRRTINMLSLAYKLSKIPGNIDLRQVYTRQADAPLLKVIAPTKELVRNSIVYKCAVLWNNLPPGPSFHLRYEGKEL